MRAFPCDLALRSAVRDLRLLARERAAPEATKLHIARYRIARQRPTELQFELAHRALHSRREGDVVSVNRAGDGRRAGITNKVAADRSAVSRKFSLHRARAHRRLHSQVPGAVEC